MISALLLEVAGVPEEDIIVNYNLSNTFLQPVSDLIAKENADRGLVGFDGSPYDVMAETLRHIRSPACGGAAVAYLNSIGFTTSEQGMLARSLVRRLLQPSIAD